MLLDVVDEGSLFRKETRKKLKSTYAKGPSKYRAVHIDDDTEDSAMTQQFYESEIEIGSELTGCSSNGIHWIRKVISSVIIQESSTKMNY